MKNKSNINYSNASYYMYGKHPVLAAIQNHKRSIEKIFCTHEFFKNNQQILNKKNIEIVDNDYINKIIGPNQNHQSIVAKVQSIFVNDIREINLSNPNCKVAILDQITDPQNIGSIIRSAAAFGIEAIILPQDNSPLENATIAKIASGTLELVKIIKVTNLKSTMELMKKEGFWIIGFDGESHEKLSNELLKGKIVLSLGSEDKGLRRLTKETCDHLVKIPMTNGVESLNVASAASIAFYMAYMN